ncbi:hypothetical protein ACLOJK_025463 [Asimina triloba]
MSPLHPISDPISLLQQRSAGNDSRSGNNRHCPQRHQLPSALCQPDPTNVYPFDRSLVPACPLSDSTSERTHQINDARSISCLACNVRCLSSVHPSVDAALHPPLRRRPVEPPFGEEGGAPYYSAPAAH